MNVKSDLPPEGQLREFNATMTRPIAATFSFKVIVVVLMHVAIAPVFGAELPAFPGAEGYGARTTGGRGGRVIAVTNLNSSGPGSLNEACQAKEPRIVVFKVSGTIEGEVRIRNDHITIAGQTAPGEGICIKGNLRLDASDIIVRYIRVRANPEVGEVDAIFGRNKKNIILDHVSASWSSDEVLSVYRNEFVTIQWCMMTEACVKFVDGKDTGHRFGGIWGNNYGTYHHNLFAHNDSRNPRWAAGSKYNDYRNNVLYNWGYNSCYGGGAVEDSDPSLNFSTFNMIANYYKPGPATRDNVKRRIAAPGDDEGVGSWYVAENVVEGFREVTENNWLGIDGNEFKKLDEPWDAMPIQQQSPHDAYLAVLRHVGCSLPKRDSIDTRIIEEVRNGTSTHGRNGIIANPADVGGWPELRNGVAPEDTDNDGMPDEWESRFGLNPKDASDNSSDKDRDGYTNVEEYLNGTDPTEFVDYSQAKYNVSTLGMKSVD
ncbi:pectate lyase [Bremerella sp.]|uniref:pectate lyase n=1 Tax=Bremerella sp. TaxID=2795602 RepID=UPI0039190697